MFSLELSEIGNCESLHYTYFLETFALRLQFVKNENQFLALLMLAFDACVPVFDAFGRTFLKTLVAT